MKIPKALQNLVEDGLIDEVIRPLMSGKEASVLVVESGGEVRCAKVYKEAKHRSFKQRANYEEGRSVRNSRRARAMAKRSKFGKQELEEEWQNTEVDTIFALARAGVRVPKPHAFSEGVLIMELVVDADGHAAPRLNDVSLSPDRARAYHAFMLNQIVRMLCAGLIHGDLSEYNVLVSADGPVLIDFPQAVNAAGNNNARSMLVRDVRNMANYFGRFAPELRKTKYGKEIWKLYERGELHPDVELTGYVEEATGPADVSGVLRDIEDARAEQARRFGRQVVDIVPERPPGPTKEQLKPSKPPRSKSRRGRGSRSGGPPADGQRKATNGSPGEGAPKKKRRRRPRKGPQQGESPMNRQGASAGLQEAGEAGPPKKRRRRRRRRSSKPPGSGGGSSSSP